MLYVHYKSIYSYELIVGTGTSKGNDPYVSLLRPRQNGRHFADDTFKRIFLNENVRIPITISLKFVPKGLISNIRSLIQIMDCDKPLSEPIVVWLPTHSCVTRPQWVNHRLPYHNKEPWFCIIQPIRYSPINICEMIICLMTTLLCQKVFHMRKFYHKPFLTERFDFQCGWIRGYNFNSAFS